MKCDNKVSGNSGKKLRETTIIYERNIKTINYGPLTIVWIISLTHLSDKCHPAVVQIMTVIFQSQRQERPDSFAAEQCWESHGGLSAARSMWHWHLRRWVRGQARALFLFNQFSVLRPTFTIEVATPKNQPVLIQVDCERSLLLKYMYVCCQAVTSSGRFKPNCNVHVVLRDWQSNLFSHFHMRMCEKNKLIYIRMSVKWIVSKGSPHCHIYVLSPIENLSYNHIETRNMNSCKDLCWNWSKYTY